jgi:hypothetical protein
VPVAGLIWLGTVNTGIKSISCDQEERSDELLQSLFTPGEINNVVAFQTVGF